MSAITYDQIKIVSPWKIQTIYQLSIRKILNNHAELYLSALINESDASKAGLQETTEDMIKVYTDDGATKSWLFKGYLKDVNISVSGGLYNLTARFLSETVILDKEQKSRSFQNTNLTYSDIVQQLLSDYSDKSAEMTTAKTQIDGPLIQYQETDWQFIKRLASLQQTVIIPDVTVDDRIFSYGYPTGYGKTLPDDINYSSGKDINAYFTDSEVNPNLIENEYAYFEVESYDGLTFGDKVTFHNYEMVVGEVTIELNQGLLVYTTKLVRPMTLRQNPSYNEKIQGISLEGKVLDVQNQELKLHLAIDQEQDEGTAHWYPFAPPTVDMMYLMPQVGTNASLYIPGLNEQNAVITSCVRTNGESCEKTGDPSTRYLGTDYGQEMKLAPGGIYFTAGRNDLVLTFDDEEGVKIASHEGIVLEAKEQIILDSKTKVTMISPNQIKMTTPTGGFSMENEIHFSNMKTVMECTDETEFPLVEQKLGFPEKLAINSEMVKALDGSVPIIGFTKDVFGETFMVGTGYAAKSTLGYAKAYLSEGFNVEKNGNYAIIKGARKPTALGEGINGTRYAFSNAAKYPEVFKFVKPSIAVQDALSFKNMGSRIGYAAVGYDTVKDMWKNIEAGKGAKKIAGDAVVDVTFGMGGIAAAAATGAYVGSIVPGAGTVAGAVAGLIVGVGYSFMTEGFTFYGKTIKDRAKDTLCP